MGYSAAPWTFKGRALYQLQLVRTEEARKYIPSDFDLVECFGWTLGGVYLARYEDSPVGAFDECVVMAGLVWNAPLSCAWAGRVFVSNREARDHGLRHVGLPSRAAAFDAAAAPAGAKQRRAPAPGSWWCTRGSRSGDANGDAPAMSAAALGKLLDGKFTDAVELRNCERGQRGLATPVATFLMPPLRTEGFLGPRMRLSLPSFSGGTAEHPGLLQYSCDLQTNVMPVTPMAIELHSSASGAATPGGSGGTNSGKGQGHEGRARWWWARSRGGAEKQAGGGEALDALLGGRPLVTLAFSDMVMKVEEPLKLELPARAEEARPAGSRAALLATLPPRP